MNEPIDSLHSLSNRFSVDFIGIGAQKCGTSWISQCLHEHPQICTPCVPERDYWREWSNYNKGIKETHYFSGRYEKGLRYYESLFDHSERGQIKGEYTPKYLYNPKVPERIQRDFPDVKLLLCLRDPIERILSSVISRYGQNPAPSLVADLTDTLLWFVDELTKRVPKPDNRLKRGLYAQQLKRYLDYFPRNNLLILFYEEIGTSPQLFIQNIYEFLGVDAQVIPASLNRKINFVPGLRELLLGDEEQAAFDRVVPVLREYYANDVDELSRMMDKDLVAIWKTFAGSDRSL